MTKPSYIRGRSANLRKGRVSEDFACYVITKNVNRRLPLLADDRVAKIILDAWQYVRSKDRIKILAFCIMLDHFHLAICLMPGESISKLMQDTAKFTSRKLNRLLNRRGTFWQEGFHDHRCRDVDDLHERSLYVEHNPVRKGLVTTAELWPYSSASAENKYMLDREWWP
ncbi:MAG TPA: transposase [Lacipirellulaceae bacterium]|nr:transposase [Lacipirellulaceae bacterium]